MECLLPYLCMVTVPHIMVRLERMLDYRGVGLARFHYTCCTHVHFITGKVFELSAIPVKMTKQTDKNFDDTHWHARVVNSCHGNPEMLVHTQDK